jgi:hypothetical protein
VLAQSHGPEKHTYLPDAHDRSRNITNPGCWFTALMSRHGTSHSTLGADDVLALQQQATLEQEASTLRAVRFESCPGPGDGHATATAQLFPSEEAIAMGVLTTGTSTLRGTSTNGLPSAHTAHLAMSVRQILLQSWTAQLPRDSSTPVSPAQHAVLQHQSGHGDAISTRDITNVPNSKSACRLHRDSYSSPDVGTVQSSLMAFRGLRVRCGIHSSVKRQDDVM